jgi:hypothetical protein
VRLKNPGNNGIERRSYISTQNSTSNVILFRDVTSSDGTTESTVTEKISQQSPVTYLTTLCEQGHEQREDLLLVRKDGEIQCLDGVDLKTRWTSPAGTIRQNTTMPDLIDHEVQFAQLSDAHTASKRLFKGREDILSFFSQEISADGFNPPILVIITRPKDPALVSDRTLHVVTLPLKIGIEISGSIRSVHPLLSIALPGLPPNVTGEVACNLQIASGILHVFGDQYLTSLDLSGSRPKIQSHVYVDNAKSFLPLSRTSVIAASEESINIYNRTFQSIQASMSLKSSLQPTSRKRKIDDEDLTSTSKACKLVAYSAKQSAVYAIAGNDLIAFQIDYRQDIPGRRRALGLLIDTLGCGIVHAPNLSAAPREQITLRSLGPYAPGSDPKLDKQMSDKFSEMDRFVLEEDVEGFERLIATELGIERDMEELNRWNAEEQPKNVNGIPAAMNGTNVSPNGTTKKDAKPIPQWVWPASKAEYPDVDPRLVQFALSRTFNWRSPSLSSDAEDPGTASEERLAITFFPHNVVHWLIETGNFNHGSIQSALRHYSQIPITERIAAGQIVDALVDVDPELTMLFALISSTHLDAVDLIHAIRRVMQSLELLGDSPVPEDHLLTNGEERAATNGDLEAEIELEQEKAASALDLAENYLGDNSSIRGRTLSIALAKLHACPEAAVISALRSNLSSSEIVSLIYLLRFELARGAWTSRYLDTYEAGGGEDETGQENAILLVAGLLNCCIDAIGAGGWLSGDSMLVNGDHFESEELIASLKLEVSAALEGIEEASYLKGLIAEMVRYGEGVQKGLPGGENSRKGAHVKRRDTRPITVAQVGREARLLPIGLKSEQQVSRHRVGAGGEIQQRSMRDIGQLKSRKVGKYTLERIVI